MRRFFSIICLVIFLLPVNTFATELPSSMVKPDQTLEETFAADEEIQQAKDMALIPEEWEEELYSVADFNNFYNLMIILISNCDESALPRWKEVVKNDYYPDREMTRGDGLVQLLLAAEALGYTKYNARGYGFCTENLVDYELMAKQMPNDYPYFENSRPVTLYFGEGNADDPIPSVSDASLYWMQRRMDVNHQKHFFDCDKDLSFHWDKSLTRADAVKAAVRLYNSETLEYDPFYVSREPDILLIDAASKAKERILNNQDSYAVKGKRYYISNNGNDKNNGLSEEKAWATLDKVNKAKLKPGDGVYFERGGLWRGQLWAQNGVTYSSYGTGEKPKIYASPENGSDPEKWKLLDGSSNIWVYQFELKDCGTISFNCDQLFGKKISPNYVDGYISSDGTSFDVKNGLTENLMFFSEANSVLHEGAPFRYTYIDTSDKGEYPDVVGKLYLRCDDGNPGEVFDSIEFCVRENIIIPAKNTKYNNLCLKYSGSHCIFEGDIGYDVSFCEIGCIGGSIQYYRYDDGTAVRFGNGVECDGSYDHFSVMDCYIYQVYDAGVSNQDPSEPTEVTGEKAYKRDVIQKNITYARNVFEYCDFPIEIFFALKDDTGFGRHRMENVSIKNNFFLYTGYGWSGRQDLHKAEYSSAYQGHNDPNASENFVIEKNVFYLSTGSLIRTNADKNWLPALNDNIYIQNENGVLIFWPSGYGYVSMFPYDKNAENVVRDVLRDENGKTTLSDVDWEKYINDSDVTNTHNCICTANKVNVRKEASQNSGSLGQLNKGDRLIVLENSGEWSRISCSIGEGYIKSKYIELE